MTTRKKMKHQRDEAYLGLDEGEDDLHPRADEERSEDRAVGLDSVELAGVVEEVILGLHLRHSAYPKTRERQTPGGEKTGVEIIRRGCYQILDTDLQK